VGAREGSGERGLICEGGNLLHARGEGSKERIYEKERDVQQHSNNEVYDKQKNKL